MLSLLLSCPLSQSPKGQGLGSLTRSWVSGGAGRAWTSSEGGLCGRCSALVAPQSPAWATEPVSTWVVEVEVQRFPDQAVGFHGAVGAAEHREVANALVPQVAHEELQADEGKDAEAENREDHHIGQLLHRLDQGPHDGLQAWGRRGGARSHPRHLCSLLQWTGARPEGCRAGGAIMGGAGEGGLSWAFQTKTSLSSAAESLSWSPWGGSPVWLCIFRGA